MNLNKISKVVHYSGLVGLCVAAFAWGFNSDIIKKHDYYNK